MFKVTGVFGIWGQFFQKQSKLYTYNGCSSSVNLAHGMISRFDISCGTQQGYPHSPFLFLLVMQIMTLV